ncbi:MAG: hypothetical protein R6U37_03510, partial [Dehalococcoidia bacterium]
MKYRMFSVLMILAMVASLCVVAAAPASAVDATVTTVQMTLGKDKAGANNVSCEIYLEGPDAGETVNITFPDGFDLSDLNLDTDSAKDYRYITWSGSPINSIDDVITVDGQVLTIVEMPSAAPGTLSLSPLAELGNPDVSEEMDGTCSPYTGNYPYACGSYTYAPSPAAFSGTECQDSAVDDELIIEANGEPGSPVYVYDWLEVSPKKFAVGDSVVVMAHGFKPGRTVTLNGTLEGSGVVRSDGTVEIGAAPTGQNIGLHATDGSGRHACMPASEFTLVPRLTISPEEGAVCSQIEIIGFDYPLSTDPGTLTWAGEDLQYIDDSFLGDFDNDGWMDDIHLVNATVPRSSPEGVVDITLGDASTEFDVHNKTITVDPASGPAGSLVTITGANFCREDAGEGGGCGGNVVGGVPGQALFVYGNSGKTGPITDLNINVDDEGKFTAVGTIPEDAPEGVHGVIVYFNSDAGTWTATNPNCIRAQGTFIVTDRVLTVIPQRPALVTGRWRQPSPSTSTFRPAGCCSDRRSTRRFSAV